MTPPRTQRDFAFSFLVLTVVALATRCQQFGNPIIHIDEQFYLLVGDRMLHGALPYVDIWDRKPIGLFLLYAGIRTLGGQGILQYQLVATGFAIATALVVRQIAARLTGHRAALLAGILYLLWIPLLTGQGGQSPVFYNLPVALAAWIVLRLIQGEPARPARLVGGGLGAMLLVGLAIQIKYSAVFEGIYFGLALLWLAVRRLGWLAGLAVAGLWAVAALTPTAIALLAYARLGYVTDFYYANFVSIFQRGKLNDGDGLKNAATLALYTAPLVILAASGVRRRLRMPDRVAGGGFVSGWFLVAALSIILFGYYFDHYGLPLVTPACVSASAFLADTRRRRWTWAVLLGAAIACLLLPWQNQRRRGTPAQFAELSRALQPYASRGLLVWDNLPMLYHVLHAPLLTRFPFPTHLREGNEQTALGLDRTVELDRILANRPAAIVVEQAKPGSPIGSTTIRLERRLASGYHRVATVRVGRRDQLVYVLNGLR